MIDSKHRGKWSSSYVPKLREDREFHGADHAILSTIKFPSGMKELGVDGDVIIASPARVVAIVKVLRRFMVRSAIDEISTEEQGSKMAALYEFIKSDEFNQKVEEATRAAEALEKLEVAEEKWHKKTWEKRGGLIKTVQHGIDDIEEGVETILDGTRCNDG